MMGIKISLLLTYKLEKPVKISISIYDKRGFVIKEICHSELVNQKAEWIWDGLTNGQTKSPTGLYMLIAEIIYSNGDVAFLKQPLVVY